MTSLAEQGHDVEWVVDEILGSDRKEQGWALPEQKPNLKISAKCSTEAGSVLATIKPDLCVFAPRGCRAAQQLLTELSIAKIPYGFMMEALGGLKPARLLKTLYLRLFSAKLEPKFTLAMGMHGARFYRSAGYGLVFPFGYTVAESSLPLDLERRDGPYKFLYLGRLIPRKRLDLLIRALALTRFDWQLNIVGQGPCENKLRALAANLGVDLKITWVPFIQNFEARKYVADADTLVLPSEWEGWGAVVNEALAEGTRLIVSSACGSACLTRLNEEDRLFKSRSVKSLLQALEQHLALGRLESPERLRRKLSHQLCNGSAMAHYFLQIAAGERPTVPAHFRE